MQGERF